MSRRFLALTICLLQVRAREYAAAVPCFGPNIKVYLHTQLSTHTILTDLAMHWMAPTAKWHTCPLGLVAFWDLYLHELTSILLLDYIHHKVWDDMIYPFPKLKVQLLQFVIG